MVIVMTTRRRGVSYLAGTLKSIGDVGTRRKIIVSDGPFDGIRPAGWILIEFPWRGARATGWACMSLALECEVPDLLLLQDDIVICDGGSSIMHACPVLDSCIATTFYSSHALPGLQPKNPGSARMILIAASGTGQALKLPRRSLEYLVAKNPRQAPNHIRDEPHRFDDTLMAFARESPWPNVAHLVPNVVRHVGEVSACGSHTTFRQPWSVRRGERFPGDVARLPVDSYPWRP